MNPSLDLYALKRDRGGIVYDNGRRWVGPGPGHSRKDMSLSVMVAPDGRALVHSFAGDPFPACADWLGVGGDRARPMDRTARAALVRQREADAKRREVEAQAFVASVWSGAQPIEATPAESYLFGRGIVLEGCEDVRFHPAAPRSRSVENEKPPYPAMVALVRDVKGQLAGLHCTYLSADGRKAFGPARSRLMFGRVGGGAVRLSPMGADGLLGVAEGIETAAAFGALKGVPTWATLSTSGLQAFVLPPNVRRLLIAADCDDGGAGHAAARTLAERAHRFCDVEIHPAPAGQDWADVAEGLNG